MTGREIGKNKKSSGGESVSSKRSHMDLKKLLASSCRQKIIKELHKSGKTNMMRLVRQINSTYNEVNRNLQILEEEGIITNGYVGRLRLIRLKRDDNRTIVLLQVLKTLESADSSDIHAESVFSLTLQPNCKRL